jgi:hypothetical protein
MSNHYQLVTTVAGNRGAVLYRLHAFFTTVANGDWDLVDRSDAGHFASEAACQTGASAAGGAWFVVRAKAAWAADPGAYQEMFFGAVNGGVSLAGFGGGALTGRLTVQYSPVGGWSLSANNWGTGFNTSQWGGAWHEADNAFNCELNRTIDAASELILWADDKTAAMFCKVGADTFPKVGFYAGALVAAEAASDNPRPCMVSAGGPSLVWGSGNSFSMGSDQNMCRVPNTNAPPDAWVNARLDNRGSSSAPGLNNSPTTQKTGKYVCEFVPAKENVGNTLVGYLSGVLQCGTGIPYKTVSTSGGRIAGYTLVMPRVP